MRNQYNRRLKDSYNSYHSSANDSLEGRISAVETAITHIESSTIDIRDSIQSGFKELRHELDQQEKDSKPKLASWAGWAAVMLVIISMFGSGYVRDLGRLELRQDTTELILRENQVATAVEKAIRLERERQQLVYSNEKLR